MKSRRPAYTTRHVGNCEIKTFRDYAAYLRWRQEQYDQLKVFDVKEDTRHEKKK